MAMPEASPVVEPKVGVMPPPAGAQTPPNADSGEPAPEASDLSPDLLKIPVIQGLLAGSPPAVSATLADFDKRPEGQIIAANKEPLMKAGMGLYRSIAGDTGVLFNRLFVSDTEISDADKSGNLAQIAPPFDAVTQQLSSAGKDHPILNPDLQTPTGLKTPPAPAIGATPAPAAMPAPAPTKVTAAKARNIPLGSPTSGPKPGAGRLLNQILKPVV